MTEENLPVPVATEELVEVPAKADPETSIRVRMGRTRDRLIESAARRMIRLGQASPRLRDAGLWLYGTATMLAPRGREVPMLGEVGEQILRGGQPSFRAFKTLQELGVNTVINLRPESDHERKMVEQLGMRYRYMPLPPLGAPSHEMTLDFLHAVTDPAAGKVFFHCYHGVDRTGTMAACLRIARDGWSPEKALEEMRAFKVHEVGQKAKIDYVAGFAEFWLDLPIEERCRVLHRPVPVEVVPAAPARWWQRLWARVKGLFG